MSARRKDARPHRGVGGFTLVELVLALVILGVLAALAVPRYLDLAHESRIAVARGIVGNVTTNAESAFMAWKLRGQNPVLIGATSVAINESGAYPAYTSIGIPAGSPTGTSMFLMLGCGTAAPADRAIVDCASLPGWSAFVWDDSGMVMFSNDRGPCWFDWWPAYGYDPTYPYDGAGMQHGYNYDYSGC